MSRGPGGSLEPSQPCNARGESHHPRASLLGSAPCWGSCPPTALTRGVSPKRTAGQPGHPPHLHSWEPTGPSKRSGREAAGRQRGKPAIKFPSLKIQNGIPKPGVQGRRVQPRVSQAGKLPSSPPKKLPQNQRLEPWGSKRFYYHFVQRESSAGRSERRSPRPGRGLPAPGWGGGFFLKKKKNTPNPKRTKNQSETSLVWINFIQTNLMYTLFPPYTPIYIRQHK